MIKKFYLAPIVFAISVVVLLSVWAAMSPEGLVRLFDQKGYSPVELATIPFYAAIIPVVWWKCPFGGARWRRVLLCAGVSCVAFMAVCKELDWHLWAFTQLWPDVVDAFKGTPFKMRFLTTAWAPFSAKVFVIAYFGLFFGVFAAMLAYYAVPLIVGFFKRDAVAWSVCFMGGSGVMVQIFDRLPAWWRHAHGLKKGAIDAFGSFCTCFEEGGELLIALFALLAIIQANKIINAKNQR